MGFQCFEASLRILPKAHNPNEYSCAIPALVQPSLSGALVGSHWDAAAVDPPTSKQ